MRKLEAGRSARAAPSVFVAPESGGETCEDKNTTEDSKGRVETSVLQGRMKKKNDVEENDVLGRWAAG